MATSQPVTGGSQVAGGDPTAVAPPHRPRGPAARARRWWPEILVVAVLAFGLSYELLRYEHVLAGHLAALVAAGILGVGIVVVLALGGGAGSAADSSALRSRLVSCSSGRSFGRRRIR